jgi:hypothetical protein
MFAKRARSLNFSRGPGLRRNAAAVRPSNDNQPVRLVAPQRRAHRPLLSCHWQRTAAGRVECHWSTDTPDPSNEGISCLAGRRVHRASIAMLAA